MGMSASPWVGAASPHFGHYGLSLGRVGLAFGAGDQFRTFLPALALQQRPKNETDADDSRNLQDVGKLAKNGDNS